MDVKFSFESQGFLELDHPLMVSRFLADDSPPDDIQPFLAPFCAWSDIQNIGNLLSFRNSSIRSHQAPLSYYRGERFGPRKLRKVAKDTKTCLLARCLFVYFVGFRKLRVPNPSADTNTKARHSSNGMKVY